MSCKSFSVISLPPLNNLFNLLIVLAKIYTDRNQTSILSVYTGLVFYFLVCVFFKEQIKSYKSIVVFISLLEFRKILLLLLLSFIIVVIVYLYAGSFYTQFLYSLKSGYCTLRLSVTYLRELNHFCFHYLTLTYESVWQSLYNHVLFFIVHMFFLFS